MSLSAEGAHPRGGARHVSGCGRLVAVGAGGDGGGGTSPLVATERRVTVTPERFWR